MENVRTYRIDDDDENWHIPDDERVVFDARSEDEVPFHVPRD